MLPELRGGRSGQDGWSPGSPLPVLSSDTLTLLLGQGGTWLHSGARKLLTAGLGIGVGVLVGLLLQRPCLGGSGEELCGRAGGVAFSPAPLSAGCYAKNFGPKGFGFGQGAGALVHSE